MRILETGNRQRESGLTLVEILIVVAIIGLLTSVVVLTIPGDPDDAETEAFVLAGQMKGARDLAIIRNQVIGLDIAESSYQFLQFGDDVWQPFTINGVQKSSTVLKNIIISVDRTDRVRPGTAGGDRDFLIDGDNSLKSELPSPIILYRPTGEVAPVEITFEGTQAQWRISQSTSAEIKVRRGDN